MRTHSRHDQLGSSPAAGGRRRGIMLIETLVYIGLLAVLISVGFAALYFCLDSSRALKRNAEDIVDALHAGEAWRADVRASTRVRALGSGDGVMLVLSGPRGEVSWRCADGELQRRRDDNDWSTVAGRVKSCGFMEERGRQTVAWRCDLEFQTHGRKTPRVRPLFTFMAVPAGKDPS